MKQRNKTFNKDNISRKKCLLHEISEGEMCGEIDNKKFLKNINKTCVRQ